MPEQTDSTSPADGDQSREVDPRRVLTKLQEIDPRSVQLAVHMVVVEDQQAEIAQLRAALVEATSGAT